MDRERFVRSFDGTELFVSTSGAGTVPLVLCDGLGCDGFIWRFLKPHFEPAYRIVRWHYRGHGLSKTPVDPAALNVTAIREDLRAVLDDLEIDRAVIVGHSLGCQIILDFAVEHPARTAGVVPVCGAFGRPLATFHDNRLLVTAFPLLRRALDRWPERGQLVWRTLVSSELAYQIATRLEVNGRLLRRCDFSPYFEHLAGMDARAFVRLAESANAHTVEERLGELRAPTLVVAGERDTFTPMWLSRRMQALVPDAELFVVPGGTHVAPLESPTLVQERIERFLAERVLGAAVPAGAPAASRIGRAAGARGPVNGAGEPAAAAVVAAGARRRRRSRS